MKIDIYWLNLTLFGDKKESLVRKKRILGWGLVGLNKRATDIIMNKY